jgi:hypothetical protein
MTRISGIDFRLTPLSISRGVANPGHATVAIIGPHAIHIEWRSAHPSVNNDINLLEFFIKKIVSFCSSHDRFSSFWRNSAAQKLLKRMQAHHNGCYLMI